MNVYRRITVNRQRTRTMKYLISSKVFKLVLDINGYQCKITLVRDTRRPETPPLITYIAKYLYEVDGNLTPCDAFDQLLSTVLNYFKTLQILAHTFCIH